MIYGGKNMNRLLRESQVLVFCALEFRRVFSRSRVCDGDPCWRATRSASTASFSAEVTESLQDTTELSSFLYVRTLVVFMTRLSTKNEMQVLFFHRKM